MHAGSATPSSTDIGRWLCAWIAHTPLPANPLAGAPAALTACAEFEFPADPEQPDFDDDYDDEIDDEEEGADPPGWEHHRER
jgi:hypothetical protein